MSWHSDRDRRSVMQRGYMGFDGANMPCCCAAGAGVWDGRGLKLRAARRRSTREGKACGERGWLERRREWMMYPVDTVPGAAAWRLVHSA